MTDDEDTTQRGQDDKAQQIAFLSKYRAHSERLRKLRARVDEDVFGEDALVTQLLNAGDADTYNTARGALDGLSSVSNEQLHILKALIAGAVRAVKGEKIAEYVLAGEQLLGLASRNEKIDHARALVRNAIQHTRSRPSETHATALMLRHQLSVCDGRFTDLDPSVVARTLSEAASSPTKVNLGRGMKGDRHALASLIVLAEAFDASGIEEAISWINSARTVRSR